MFQDQPASGRYTLRQADWQDAIHIQKVLNGEVLIHRYLDWRDPLYWLGHQPFFMLEEKHELRAVMASPADPPGIAWVRLFACSWNYSLSLAWRILLDQTKAYYSALPIPTHGYILALEDWMDALLRQMGFQIHQEIIVLQRDLPASIEVTSPTEGVSIRPMVAADMDRIANIDAACFEALWVYSVNTLKLAFEQSSIALIAEMASLPVGYLLGTVIANTAHLARIAVKPEVTRHHIASRLIQHMFRTVSAMNIPNVTLNTQSDNQASLALYDTMGFRKTGETFNVYQIM